MSELKIGETVDHYRFRPLPWVSKSKIMSWRFCKYAFFLDNILELEAVPMDNVMKKKQITGTDMHLVVALFWKEVKERDLVEDLMRMPLELDYKNSRIFWAIYSLCQEIMPKEARVVKEFAIILSNFAQLQVENWIWISQNIGTNKKDYEKYWIPIYVELYLEDPNMKYHGTIDVVYNNPNYKNDKRPYIVLDYKTGHVPKSVRDYKGEGAVSLPTSKLMELHFYAWMMANAKKPKYKKVRMCTAIRRPHMEEDNLVDDYEECGGEVILDPDDGHWKCSKCGSDYGDFEGNVPEEHEKQVGMENVFPEIKSFKDVKIGMIFLGYDKPYVAPKTPNAKTMSNVHRDAGLLRKDWEEFGDDEDKWERDVNDFKCPKCMQGGTCTERRMAEIIGA